MAKVTEVWPNLWIGGSTWPLSRDQLAIDLLVTVCEEWECWFTPEADEFVNFPMIEGTLFGTDLAELDRIVGVVVQAIRDDRTTMVRCRAGHERSAMVVTLALMELTNRSAEEVVADLRDRHVPDVLAVPDSEFLAHVLTHGKQRSEP